jgi:thioredoxin 1
MLGVIGAKKTIVMMLPIFLNPFTVKGFRGFLNCCFFSGTPVGYIGNNKREEMNKTISKKEFKKEVIDNMSLSLVQFTLEWSGACQIISPMYDELADSYKGQAKFFTIDVEKERGIDGEYGIMEVPTILFFKRGRVVDHVTGLTPKNVLISKIENALNKELN